MPSWRGVLEQYRDLLDLAPDLSPITLLEGNTPLLPLPHLGRDLGCRLYVKFEGLNPTGSFKDRGMTAAVSVSVAQGARTVICASTGNTAASAAAYAARAGMRCVVLIPSGQVASGKLAGARAYGAQVWQVEGSFDRALDLVQEVAPRIPADLVNSVNPNRLEGQATAAFEINEALGAAPDWLTLPVGNAGNITSLWIGFQRHGQKNTLGLPHLLGVQAAGAAPLVLGHPVEDPQTLASAIRIGKPARGDEALVAAWESGGKIIAAADPEILQAQADLASEGIWVEPASAAGLAGVRAEISARSSDLRGKSVVILATGHGLKDPVLHPHADQTPRLVPADAEALTEILRQ